MPVLAAYVDLHSISVLVYVSADNFYFYNYPYVYSPEIFSSSYTATSFYRSVFDYFCKQSNIKLADCDILLTGFLEPPKTELNPKLSLPLFEVLNKVSGSFPIVVNNFSVLTKKDCVSRVASNLMVSKDQKVVEMAEQNYYANMAIYPQVIASDMATQIDIDRNITRLGTDLKAGFSSKEPLVFCGSRFSQLTLMPELTYLLVLGLVRSVGVFDFKIDTYNSTILFALLKAYDPSADPLFELENEGTLVSSYFNTECMLKSEIGTSQVVEVTKDKIFVLPVGKDEHLKLVIQSRDLNTIERTIVGGNVGVVFDTRADRDERTMDFKVFNSGIRTFSNVLGI